MYISYIYMFTSKSLTELAYMQIHMYAVCIHTYTYTYVCKYKHTFVDITYNKSIYIYVDRYIHE